MSSGTQAIEEPYRGALGTTRRERVHWACPCGVLHSVEVVVGVDCATDPELAAALRDGAASFNRAVCPITGARGRVDVPVVYHDPDEPLFVLVLPTGARARELQERAALLDRLARDVECDVPSYVVGFAAVHEAAGLRAHLGRAVTDTRGVYGVEGAVTLPRMRVVSREVSEEEAAVTLPRMRVVAREVSEDEVVTSPRMPAVQTELVTIAVAGEEGPDEDEIEADTQTLARRGPDGQSNEQPAAGHEELARGEGLDGDGDVSLGSAASAEEPALEGGRDALAMSTSPDAGERADPVDSRSARLDQAAPGPREARAIEGRADGAPAGSPPGPGGRHTRPDLGPASADLDEVMGAIDAAIAAIDGSVPADPAPDAPAVDPTVSWSDGDDVTATGDAAVGGDVSDPAGPDPTRAGADAGQPASGEDAADPDGRDRGESGAAVVHAAPAGACGADARGPAPDGAAAHGAVADGVVGETGLVEAATGDAAQHAGGDGGGGAAGPDAMEAGMARRSRDDQAGAAPLGAVAGVEVANGQAALDEGARDAGAIDGAAVGSVRTPREDTGFVEAAPDAGAEGPARGAGAEGGGARPGQAGRPGDGARVPELGVDGVGAGQAAPSAGAIAVDDELVAGDPSVSAAWTAAATAAGVGAGTGAHREGLARAGVDGAGDEADPDDELDSIDVPIHVAGEGTGMGPAPLEGADGAAPDPTSSRRVGADGRVTIGLVAEGAELAALVAAELEVRLQLHRMPNFPLLALVFGDAAALDGAEGTSPPRWVLLDIGDEEDRAALHGLGRLFEVHLEIQDGSRDGAIVATSMLSPPLADNVLAALAAAVDYLKGVPLDQRSFARARTSFRAPDYDRLGLATSLAGDLDEEVLRGLATPAQVMRAVALVKRFSQPTGEDWLLMSRSYPLEGWHSSRRAVVKRAFELGIWPGPVAAQIAVGEGLARSRKELVMRLQRNFTALLDQPVETGAAAGEAPAESLPAPAHDLDDGAVRENWKALKAEARALGVPAGEWSQPRSSPIVSESAPIASGTIDLFAEAGEEESAFARPGRRRARTAAYGEPVGGDGIGAGRSRGQRAGVLARLDSGALVGALEDRDRRLAAALELCRRGEESAAGAVFATVDGLSRAEAGLVLGSVGFLGRAAEPHLLAGLRSRKAHIRQGSALALAVMRSEAGVEAICDLLLDDPTAIWRELARALGETGATAVMPLVARLGQRSMAARERAAWALAHIGARGHRRPLEALASGRDQVAASVARRAIELIEAAQSDDLAVRGDRAPRDQTMNRAFSRRFFDAVRAERRAAAEAAAAASGDSETEVEPAAARAVAGRATGATSGTAVLDESDMLDAVDVDGEGEIEVDEKMEVEVADDAAERGRAPG